MRAKKGWTDMSSMEEADRASAAVAKEPRVSLADIEAQIGAEYRFTAAEAVHGLSPPPPIVDPLKTMTICILVMKNGFVVIGKSAPASPANFDKDLGYKFARDDAIRQLWPLMGFALRQHLHEGRMLLDEPLPEDITRQDDALYYSTLDAFVVHRTLLLNGRREHHAVSVPRAQAQSADAAMAEAKPLLDQWEKDLRAGRLKSDT